MDFRGFDSSIILILRGGIPSSVGDFPEESLTQAMLVGVVLVGRLDVPRKRVPQVCAQLVVGGGC